MKIREIISKWFQHWGASCTIFDSAGHKLARLEFDCIGQTEQVSIPIEVLYA